MNSLVLIPSKGHKVHPRSHSEDKAIAQNVRLRYTETSTTLEFILTVEVSHSSIATSIGKKNLSVVTQ